MNQTNSSLTIPKAQLNRPQNTVARPVEFCGPGLFHGYEANVRLLPAEPNTGIVFRRTDRPDAPDIPARCEYVTTAPRRTVLAASNEAVVETVEHLMAALAGLQIDNCLVTIDAPEIPAYDGSCRDFCDGILDAGIQSQGIPVDVVAIDGITSVHNQNDRQSLSIRPYVFQCPAITYHLDYGAGATIAPQVFSAEITPEYFYQHIAAARTFVLESEIKALRSMGYGRHLTAKDIVIVGADGVIDNELRWANEGVRHKILDCVGDLALSGRVFFGHVTACRSGHHLNHELANKLSTMNKYSATVLHAA